MVKPEDTASNAEKSLYDRVAAVLDSIRPMVQSDGGDIELVGVDADGVVKVRLQGACVGCPSASMTLALGIERNLKNQIPEVTRVVGVP
jgi:Fe-S cluster biogenesis protein NfuA